MSTQVEDEPTSYRWFTIAWAAALLFHLAGNYQSLLRMDAVGQLQALMAILAAAVIATNRPTFAGALGAVHLIIIWLKLPEVGNHEVILGLTALTVVLSVIRYGNRWLARAVPTLRFVLLISYGWIAFSKLNSAFFDPAVSCAALFSDELGQWFGVQISDSRAASLFAIFSAAAIELAVVPLLIIRRTRPYGLLLAVCFHSFLALEPIGHVWDFTTTLYPLLLLFGSAGLNRRLERVAERFNSSFTPLGRFALVLIAIGIEVIVLLSPSAAWAFAYPLWLLYAAGLIWLLIETMRASLRAPAEVATCRLGQPWRSVVLWPVLLIALANGISPYLQLRTAGAFNMYSNLQVHGEGWNHLLVPQAISGSGPEVFWVSGLEDEDDPFAIYQEANLGLARSNLARFKARGGTTVAVLSNGDGGSSLGDLNLDTTGFDAVLRSKIGALRAIDGQEPKRCLRYWGPAD